MRLTYSIIYSLLILAILTCAILARRSGKPNRSSVSLLEASLIPPIVGNLMLIGYSEKNPALLGCYVYFLGMDLVLFALVNFTNSYCRSIGDGNHKPMIIYIALAADAIQMLLNPIFGHAFDVEPIEVDGAAYYTLIPHWGQTIHRVIDYGAFFCVVFIFILATIKTPKIYRERYIVILVAVAIIGLLQTYYIYSKSQIDRSMIGYGIFGILIFIFAIRYRPLRLLDRILSEIVSDLSDAFYIFDSNSNCIWANEQGFELAGIDKDNIEAIDVALYDLFRFKGHLEEHSVKRTVNTVNGDRYYLLEESHAKDDTGKLNGFYLRIQDVTESEHELKIKEEQIGQISQEAYKDSLTGVGNKAAYNKTVTAINAEIASGMTDFAVVMIDMNDLKRINDDYGHKAGDIYIKGCCHMICEAFKHSPVFRIGGDEFIAILRGHDYITRVQNLAVLRASFVESSSNTDIDPWLRYSAAVGIAEHASNDTSFEVVFKRADEAMYDDKRAFKEEHGSYR